MNGRNGFTIIEVLVAAGLVPIVMGLAVESTARLSARAGARIQTGDALSQTLRVLATLEHDLAAAVPGPEWPQVSATGRSLGLKARSGERLVTVWYRFDPGTGVLERSADRGLFHRVNAVPLKDVAFAIGARTVMCVVADPVGPMKLVRTLSRLEDAAVPAGWMEP